LFSKSEYNKYKLDFIIKTFVHLEQFAQWLRKFFYLNHELSLEYDTIYQESFYVTFHELITVGLDYSKKVLSQLTVEDEKKQWYKNLVEGLEKLKGTFSEIELQYIKYKRHNSSHIFQNDYEHKVFEKGENLTPQRENKIDQNEKDFTNLIRKHGGDKKFDLYMHHKIFPIASDLYDQLQANKNQNKRQYKNKL